MPGFNARRQILWEWACSRRGRPIRHHSRLTRRFREQARSHSGSVLCRDLMHAAESCGSGLAHEEGITFSITAA
ncbi:hypothetical protein EVS84_13575 [Pseudomonas koreensis]|uniref:Uncharacterized protein n=1 Tax=Pseudomonas koreensis TaxID=198620 RepID=A0A4Q4L536_9PSED|nr:hypothetical protein EVS84_13575 [Pseudomonas koreensis]